MIRIAVLVSGSGSNLQALIDAKLSGQIVGVISNRADAYALERAKQHNIATAVISHRDFPTREAFDAQMHQQLIAWEIALSELDAGQAIAQAMLSVKHNDNTNTLATRIHYLEHFIYPRVVEWFCQKQLIWQNSQVYFDQQLLTEPIVFFPPQKY